MRWPQANVASLVALFVIPADSIKAGTGCLFVEPDAWEQTPCSLNALHRRAFALVLYCKSLETGCAHMIFETDASNCVCVGTVVRQNTKNIAPVSSSKPIQMGSERLTLRFIVVQDSNFSSDELGDPDACRVIETYVPECFDFHQRVRLHLANAALRPCFCKMLGEISARQHRGVVACPDMRILVRLASEAVKAFLLKDAWEPRIVGPVGLNNRCICW